MLRAHDGPWPAARGTGRRPARQQPFTAEDAELLAAVANQVAFVVKNSLAHQEITELKDKIAAELKEEIRTEHSFEEIIGDASALKHVLKLVETVAPTESTVLIRGETGTGKELIARRSLIARPCAPMRIQTSVTLPGMLR
ncbi:MAG TPA: sigma 54-interacting transcriptional regulator [Myxococcota bacterium]|nr:sigma 54-interacting transcriptional regulator [Myxococcota bacterium]